MDDSKLRLLMYLGVGMMVAGVVLPFLIVIKLITSTYFLNFFSYTLQIVGLILAMIGLVNFAVHRKK